MTVRVLSHCTWARVCEPHHRPHLLASTAPDVLLYVQGEPGAPGTAGPLSRGSELVFTSQKLPLTIPTVRPAHDKPTSSQKPAGERGAAADGDVGLFECMGVGLLEWSVGGRYLASRNNAMPRACFLWEGEALSLRAVLLLAQLVRAIAWHPSRQLRSECARAPACSSSGRPSAARRRRCPTAERCESPLRRGTQRATPSSSLT